MQISEKAREKKQRVYVGFMGLEKAYNRVKMEALWQVLKLYNMEGKLLNGVEGVYINVLG